MKIEETAEMTEGMDPRSLVGRKYFIPAEFVNVGCINFYDGGSTLANSGIYGYNPETNVKTYLSGENALKYLRGCADAGVLCINGVRIVSTETAYDTSNNEEVIGMIFYDGSTNLDRAHFAPLVAGTMYPTQTETNLS
jgi:hypothetical protein